MPVRAEGGLQLHLLDGRSVYPISASELNFEHGEARKDGTVLHRAKFAIDWEAESYRPAVPTTVEISVVESADGKVADVRAACSGWYRAEDETYVLDANVISEGLTISLAPMEGDFA